MKSIDRALIILTYLSHADKYIGINQMCRDLSLNPASAYRALQALKKHNWVSQDPLSSNYGIGGGLLQYSLSIIENLNIKKISRPYLIDLRDAANESTFICILSDFHRIIIDKVDSLNEVRHVPVVGTELPLWGAAGGKAILAFLKKSERNKFIDVLKSDQPPQMANGKELNLDALLTELSEIRKKGFAVSGEERLVHVSSVAAPIFERKDNVVGSIAIVGPMPRFNKKVALSYGQLIKKAADEISEQMDYTEKNMLAKP